MPGDIDRIEQARAPSAADRQEQKNMKSKTRFIKSVVDTAKAAEIRLPFARQTRTPRAAAARPGQRRA